MAYQNVPQDPDIKDLRTKACDIMWISFLEEIEESDNSIGGYFWISRFMLVLEARNREEILAVLVPTGISVEMFDNWILTQRV